jgi:hypothetical protein
MVAEAKRTISPGKALLSDAATSFVFESTNKTYFIAKAIKAI